MDTLNSLQKEDRIKVLTEAKEQLEAANYRFNSESGKDHPNDPTAKDTYANKIKANEEEIKKIDEQISALKGKKKEKEEAKTTI